MSGPGAGCGGLARWAQWARCCDGARREGVKGEEVPEGQAWSAPQEPVGMEGGGCLMGRAKLRHAAVNVQQWPPESHVGVAGEGMGCRRERSSGVTVPLLRVGGHVPSWSHAGALPIGPHCLGHTGYMGLLFLSLVFGQGAALTERQKEVSMEGEGLTKDTLWKALNWDSCPGTSVPSHPWEDPGIGFQGSIQWLCHCCFVDLGESRKHRPSTPS